MYKLGIFVNLFYNADREMHKPRNVIERIKE